MAFALQNWIQSPDLSMISDFLYANSVLAVFSWNVSTANSEGRQYF